MTEGEEQAHADRVLKAKESELDAWEQFKVYSPVTSGTQTKDALDTRWALTRKEAGGKQPKKARLAAKGKQEQDLRRGNRGIAGCVSRRSSHLQLISMEAQKKWEI